MNDHITKPRGGKRAGAGRKPLPDAERRKVHTITLKDEHAEKARRISDSGDNLSAGVEKAIETFTD